ncbi:teratocarcinoma-derived growth factor 1 [Diretmus argenteus]
MNWTRLLRILVSTVLVQTAAASPGCEKEDCSTSQGSKDLQLSQGSKDLQLSQGSKDLQLSQGFLGQLSQVNSPDVVDRKHRDAGAVLPFIGLTGSAQQNRTCCKNGGTCILGSFCACPPYFAGRRCEYDERIRRCGLIPHGVWVQKGCSYCRCGYGVLHCFPHVFLHCDDSEEVRWFHSSGVPTIEMNYFLYLTSLLPLLLFR